MLHKYGTPAYRLEAHLMEVATYLGLKSSFVMSPTSVTFVIWTDGHEDEYTHVARVDPGDHDLGSLADTDDLVNQMLDDKLTLQEVDAQQMLSTTCQTHTINLLRALRLQLLVVRLQC
ncbi:threonine/serine exporter family protein [Pseudoalteromonas sp. B193]